MGKPNEGPLSTPHTKPLAHSALLSQSPWPEAHWQPLQKLAPPGAPTQLEQAPHEPPQSSPVSSPSWTLFAQWAATQTSQPAGKPNLGPLSAAQMRPAMHCAFESQSPSPALQRLPGLLQ